MELSLPSALIIGIDNFVAIKLAKELLKKDIRVVGVGDFVSELADLGNNFTWIGDIREVEGEYNYVFDFWGDLSVFKEGQVKGNKVTWISVDNDDLSSFFKKELPNMDLDWRLIESYGVYGVGMNNSNFLAEILEMAVKNKNLEVPLPEQKIRLLEVSDLVEAILRASFLSGTDGESFLILGNEINSEDLAKILIDKAKMTKMKVFQKKTQLFEGSENEKLNSEKKLRWLPKIEFKKGIGETLQYFFSKIDEENRSKKTINKVKSGVKNKYKETKVAKKIEVVVEEDKNKSEKIVIGDEEDKIGSIKVFDDEAEKRDFEDETIEEEDDSWEIPKFTNKTNKLVKDESEDKESEDKVSLVGTKVISNKNRNSFWLFVLVLGLLLLLMIPIDWGLKSFFIYKDIKNVPELVKTKKYAKASELVENDLNKLVEMDDKINDWSLNGLNWFRNYQSTLKVAIDILGIERDSIDLVKTSDLVMGAIFNGNEIDWESSINTTKKELEILNGNLGLLEVRLTGDLSWLPSKWRMEAQKQVSNLADLREKISYGLEIVDVLPDFLGVGVGEKKYLILFQNESELRATGGFIGSYGLLTFDDGKLRSLDVKDIYEADGQLEGHVEPPVEIKNYLGEANWYMRDANWKADFVEASTDIQWFLKKETGEQVDGVIGIDLAVAKSILGVVGEIYVPDFEEKINEDNLYEQAEFYAEKEFFPGSNQKASFLGGLGKQMFEEIKSLSISKKAELVGKTIDLLEKNEIQLAINDEGIAEKMTILGWSGEIYKGKCGTDNCVMDYFYLVESNLGVNKANYFLYRNIEQSVDISNNSISRVVKITYQNIAKNSSWPGGDYKNYIRLYLPNDVNLSQVIVMDGSDTTVRKVYKSSDLRIREIGGKKEVGFLMTVPVSKSRIVEIRYLSNVDLSGKTNFSYINYIQRQPGSGETGLVNLLSYPDGWQLGQVQPAATLVGGKLLFNQKLSEDIRMGVELEK